MSLRDSNSAAAGVPIADDFQARFVRDAHVLVAEGFERLEPAALAKKTEEAISGDIVNGINAWFDDPAAPSWTKSYFVKPEIPLQTRERQGKRRPRIDIYVESSEPHPRARFAFEAKRIYRSDSVAEYVGSSGLGAFLDGTHEVNGPTAGMLGYVQHGTNGANIDKVRRKLESDRNSHCLGKSGAAWEPISLDARLGKTWVSKHRRKRPRLRLDVYHSFLRCC